MSKKIKLQVPVTGEEFERYKRLAMASHLSMPQFVAGVLRRAHPPESEAAQVATLSGQPTVPRSVHLDVTDIMGEAYLSDADDPTIAALEAKLEARLVSSVQPRPQAVVEAVDAGAPAAQAHPCLHLNATPPVGYTRADCQGGCRAQANRPCHWPAGSARQCPMYRGLS